MGSPGLYHEWPLVGASKSLSLGHKPSSGCSGLSVVGGGTCGGGHPTPASLLVVPRVPLGQGLG